MPAFLLDTGHRQTTLNADSEQELEDTLRVETNAPDHIITEMVAQVWAGTSARWVYMKLTTELERATV